MLHVRRYGGRFLRALALGAVDPFFLFYCGSWILIRLTRTNGMPIPYVNNWLTDLVFVPLLAHVSFVVGNTILNQKTPLRYPLYQILIIAAFVSIVFEVVMPKYTSYNTADPLDAVAYFTGGLGYYFWHQPFAARRMAY